MTDDKAHGAAYGYGAEQGDEQAHFDAPASPKHHKKDTKRYVAFHSDEIDSHSSEVEDETPRKDRKKVKKDTRSHTFKDKFRSIKVKKKEKEGKEKSREKEEKKEKKEKKKQHKRSLSAGESLTPIQIQSPPPASPVFGVPLEVAIARSRMSDGIELPCVFRECIQYLEEKGLDQEGIYRVSGVKSKIDDLKSSYNHGLKANLDAEDIEPNIVAGLLKLYLRELPVNVLTAKLLPVFDSLVGLKDEADQVNKMKQLLADLPKANFTLISWLFVHLDHVMQRGSETKMGIQNISIVFSPTMNISHGILFIIMTHINELFPGVKIIKCVEPVKYRQDNLPSPHSPKSLEEELSKQEVFLDDLHRRMKEEAANEEDVMDQMWEVQRTVTQLKRRLKTIRRSQLPKTEGSASRTEGKESKDAVSTARDSSKDVSLETAATNKETRSKMQLEIDQGKRKLQSLIKEDGVNRRKVSEENLSEEGGTVKSNEDLEVKRRNAKDAREKEHEVSRKIEEDSWMLDAKKKKQEDALQLEMKKKKEEEDFSKKKSEDGLRLEMKKKQEDARIKRRHDEHSRILEMCKVDHSKTSVVEKTDKEEPEEEEIDKNDEVGRSSGKEDDLLANQKEEVKDEGIIEDASTSEDEEIKELLREEHRLIIEQEELNHLSARLKSRIQREANDIDRLQLEVDELKKGEDGVENTSSIDEDSSSSDSSDSGTDSDEDNSDLEDILKELEKENEKLENQTVDLMKSLMEERSKLLQLRVDVRFAEEYRI
eukprot:gene12280-13545_t